MCLYILPHISIHDYTTMKLVDATHLFDEELLFCFLHVFLNKSNSIFELYTCNFLNIYAIFNHLIHVNAGFSILKLRNT